MKTFFNTTTKSEISRNVSSMSKNLFNTATVIKSPAKSGKNGAKAEVTVKGLELYAALDAAAKAIKGLQEANRGELNDQIFGHFVNEGARSHTQPANFRGIEGEASASCELRKRSTRSVLNEQEVTILAENNIPVEVIEDKPETFIINPTYLEDAKLMKKVGEQLGKITGIPADFILKQEAKRSTVASDESLAAVFKLAADKIAELLPVVGVTAIKAQTAESLADTLKTIAELV
jgi:hypothetical protein